MRGVFVAAAIVLVAAGCWGCEPGAVPPQDVLADGPEEASEPGTDPGGPDAYADDGARLDAPLGDEAGGPEEGFIEDEGMDPGDAAVQADADVAIATDDGVGLEEAGDVQDVEGADNPEAEVGPATIRHFGWFGPGAAGAGGRISAFGSVCGLRQAWKVQ